MAVYFWRHYHRNRFQHPVSNPFVQYKKFSSKMKKLNLASLNNAEANYLLQLRPTSITTLNLRFQQVSNINN